MNKRSNILQIVLFLGFIVLFALLFLLVPDRDFSEQENRYLSKAPKFSFDALFEGKFTTKFEDYLTDQFVGRDNWIDLKARSEIGLGKQSNNGVYLCAEDTLIQRLDRPDQGKIDANLQALSSLSENTGKPVYFALIPGAAEIWRDKLPKNAPSADQKALIDNAYAAAASAAPVDVFSALEAHKDEYIYYRTDHHWTTLGAYYGYTALAEAMGFDPQPLDSFKRETVAEDFYGTVYSKSGMHWIGPDSINIYTQDMDVHVLNYSTGTPQEGSIYVFSHLEEKDKYSMFMGGNTPLLTIETGNADAPSLLILRDSYMDSQIPFLLNHFSSIHVLDLRYYKDSVSTYVQENEIDQILVSYSVSNFSSDTSITQLSS